MAGNNLRFVSERQLEEERKAGILAPRTVASSEPAKALFEQLKENREKAEEEWRETHKFRGPRALDEEDVAFLVEYNRSRQLQKLQQLEHEKEELAKFEEERSKLVYKTETGPLLGEGLLQSHSVKSVASTVKSETEETNQRPKVRQKKADLTSLLAVQVVAKRKHSTYAEEQAKTEEKQDNDTNNSSNESTRPKKVVVLQPILNLQTDTSKSNKKSSAEQKPTEKEKTENKTEKEKSTKKKTKVKKKSRPLKLVDY
jgi:hypothetical protein